MAVDHMGLPLCGTSQDLMMNTSDVGIGVAVGSVGDGGGVGGDGFGVSVGGTFCYDLNHVNNLQRQQMVEMMMIQQNNQQQHQDQQRNKNKYLLLNQQNEAVLPCPSSAVAVAVGLQSHVYSPLQVELEKHSVAIDGFLSLQNEKLKAVLHEQRKQQMALILRSTQGPGEGLLISKKDEEIARAKDKTMQLEDAITKIEMEKQAWAQVAKEKQTLATSLNNALKQLKEDYCCSSSSANGSGFKNNKTVQQDQKKVICKGCFEMLSSVLFLPCKHMCCCKVCEPYFDSCPVCKAKKNATIDVFMC